MSRHAPLPLSFTVRVAAKIIFKNMSRIVELKISYSILILSIFGSIECSFSQPYLPSSVISGVTYDKKSKEQLAPGSDNFQVTWADDNHQYAAWGDGGGFGGTNLNGRVKLGVARIEGNNDNYRGYNVWGGYKTENLAQFDGKSWGMICIDSILYMWATTESHPHIEEVRLAYSKDHGAHWTKTDVVFYNTENMTIPTFLQFGRNYDGAIDEYVFSYFIHSLLTTEEFGVNIPGKIYLARVRKADMLDKSKYKYFSGMHDSLPTWTTSLEKKQPVFKNAVDGVGWNLSVSYNAPLERYFLMTEHTESHAGYHGMFDAPNPWGPWTTVEYDTGNWLGYGSTFFRCFSNKWLSGNGRDFVMIYTGTNWIGTNDAWNYIEGSFTVAGCPGKAMREQ